MFHILLALKICVKSNTQLKVIRASFNSLLFSFDYHIELNEKIYLFISYNQISKQINKNKTIFSYIQFSQQIVKT